MKDKMMISINPMKKDLFKPFTIGFALVPAFAESGQAATLLDCNSFDVGKNF